MKPLVKQVLSPHRGAGLRGQAAVTHFPVLQSLCIWMTHPASAWLAASPQVQLAAGATVRRTVRVFAVAVATTHRAE